MSTLIPELEMMLEVRNISLHNTDLNAPYVGGNFDFGYNSGANDKDTFVHELGHVWGNLDEYDAGFLENHLSPGHVASDSPYIKDQDSIMNIGKEFRTRFFTHFGRAIAAAFWNEPGTSGNPLNPSFTSFQLTRR